MHVDDLFLLIEECLCAVSERSSTSNVARSLLLGCARSTFCNKTQSKHIENLLVLIEECLCAFSERSDAQEGQSKKSSAAAKDRHPKPIPSQHPDDIYTRYGLALVRVCRLHPPPGARGSTFPRLHQQQHFARHRKRPPRARERVRVSTPSATTTSVSSMSSRRPCKHYGTASPPLRQHRHLHELVVAQGLHDTLIQRLTEDLQRVAVLASVGVTPKKARARKAP